MNHPKLKKIIEITYQAKKPLFIEGAVGIGKSYSVKQFAKEQALKEQREFIEWNAFKDKHLLKENPEKYFVFADIRASQLDASDVRGLPFATNGSIEWKIPAVFDVFTRDNLHGVIFFDEINLAPPLIQSSLYQIILDRQVGEKSLNPDVFLVGAGNPADDVANVFEFSTALKNRFVYVVLDIPTINEWTSWALENNIDKRIISFLQFKKDYLHGKLANINEKNNFPTPRSWHFLSDLIKEIDDLDIIRELSIGCVGQQVGVEFTAFIELEKKLNIKDYLKNPKKLKELKMNEKYALLTSALNYALENKKQTKEIIDFYYQNTEKEIYVLLLSFLSKELQKKNDDIMTYLTEKQVAELSNLLL